MCDVFHVERCSSDQIPSSSYAACRRKTNLWTLLCTVAGTFGNGQMPALGCYCTTFILDGMEEKNKRNTRLSSGAWSQLPPLAWKRDNFFIWSFLTCEHCRSPSRGFDSVEGTKDTWNIADEITAHLWKNRCMGGAFCLINHEGSWLVIASAGRWDHLQKTSGSQGLEPRISTDRSRHEKTSSPNYTGWSASRFISLRHPSSTCTWIYLDSSSRPIVTLVMAHPCAMLLKFILAHRINSALAIASGTCSLESTAYSL